MVPIQTSLDNLAIFGEIVTVHVRSLSETYLTIDSRLVGDRVDVERYWRKIALGEYQLFTVAISDKIVGFILATPSRFSDRDSWEIRAQYVLQQHQGIGLGRSLFQTLRNSLLQMGARNIDILVHSRNTGAQAFFVSMGALLDRHDTMDANAGLFETVLLRVPLI